jgi:hypothetical protein
MPKTTFYDPKSIGIGLLILFGACLAAFRAEAVSAPKLKITTATWSVAKSRLTVKGQYRNGSATAIDVYDTAGRLVGTAQVDSRHKFSLTLSHPEQQQQLCSVTAKADTAQDMRVVSGSAKQCAKAPLCKIVAPRGVYSTSIKTDADFEAKATLRDRKAGPLRLEWDFAGGAMGEWKTDIQPPIYQRPGSLKTTVQFVRDNAYYRVRFSAWDKRNRYCEDSVLVKVGAPPTELPAVAGLVAEAQQSASPAGSQMAGIKDDLVVLPFADLTMPGAVDYRYIPNIEQVTADGAFSNLNAVVYRKDRLPPQVEGTDVTLKYRASSNPRDPVAADSINTTSQNWPLNPEGADKAAPLSGAVIQKTDFWEVFQRPAEDLLAEGYTSRNWPSVTPQFNDRVVGPDEGLVVGPTPADPAVSTESQGRYMPGRGAPYAENADQDFTSYDSVELRHLARAIPATDVDDQGRINPFPLLRVSAVETATGKAASADAVVASGRDVHCRECHAKGKIGANDKLDWNSMLDAFHSSPFYGNRGCWFPEPYCSLTPAAPSFETPDSESLFDQELAANRNIASLHAFYDNTGEVGMANGWYSVVWSQKQGVTKDQPNSCNWCHGSHISGQMTQLIHHFPDYQGTDSTVPSMSNLSGVVHNWHALLQLDPADSNKILRNGIGRPKLWDPADGANPRPLFPTVDAQGNALPMEQNCLRCHAGHREQLYRDRMYTAGVTCYDCHGDMLAVGGAYAKPAPGTEGNTHRFPWYEQPDCGSCHTGNANAGTNGTNGFYSAGVMKRAFDDSDPSATPRKPESQRFAVLPGKNMLVEMLENTVSPTIQFGSVDYWWNMNMPLFRQSRDNHGNVPCAACHGGAHENWPNRDPKANDNVTAVQLQGYAGHILECNVCHTADSFKELEDQDGGKFMTDVAHMKDFPGGGSGVLGGPHNTHAVADENWWKEAKDNIKRADDTGKSGTYGGWHNDLAKQPGRQKEDQCAACHGNDHRGTRLSKTPVDRVFDFSSFDFGRLRKAGFKKRIIKVAAGSEIGCNTCHSIKTSCIDSPAKDRCGKPTDYVPENDNHDPVITSTPTLTAVFGQPYSYKVVATDQDTNDKLTYTLVSRPWDPDTMKIDENGTITYDWPTGALYGHNFGPLTFPYTVRVTDGRGGYATQTVRLTLSCPAGQTWVNPGWEGACVADSVGAAITSTPAIQGLNAGEIYRYQVTATSEKNLELGFSLVGAPSDANIGAASGLLEWNSPAKGGSYGFTVKAEDSAGGVAYQRVTVDVCVSPEIWHADHGMCMRP